MRAENASDVWCARNWPTHRAANPDPQVLLRNAGRGVQPRGQAWVAERLPEASEMGL